MGYERLWGTGGWTDPAAGSFAARRRRRRSTASPRAGGAGRGRRRPRRAASGVRTLAVRSRRPPGRRRPDRRPPRLSDAGGARAAAARSGAGRGRRRPRGRPAARRLRRRRGDARAAAGASSCAARRRRITPDALDGLVTVGEEIEVAGVRIAVRARRGDRFTVAVEGERAHFAPLKPALCLVVPDQCEGSKRPRHAALTRLILPSSTDPARVASMPPTA